MKELFKAIERMELDNKTTEEIKNIVTILSKIVDVNCLSYWEENFWRDGKQSYISVNTNTNHLGFDSKELNILNSLHPSTIELYTATDGRDNLKIYLNIEIRLK